MRSAFFQSFHFRAAAGALAVLILLAGCGNRNGASPQGGPGAKPPPIEVGVVTASLQPVALQTELPGRVDPLRVAQVRARVNGVVLKRLFREGSEVKEGQLLYQIDPAPYRAALESAQAQLARAEANLTQAGAQAERYKPLVEANAVSKQDYINVVAAQKQAQADVAAGKAAVQTAKINLGYASVRAPIAGRIGRALVTEGALVSASAATELAMIQQTRTVYVNFTQSAGDLMRLRKTYGVHPVRGEVDKPVPVTVVFDDGTEFPKKGKLLFSDISVDQTTGQITLRAEVPNQDGMLLPGQYVRVRLSQAELPKGILLPQQAVTRSDKGDTVLVVGADGKPMPRQIKVGAAQDNQWVVLEGLKPGEQVVVDGFQKMMMAPGAPVKPVPWKPVAQADGGAPPANAAASGKDDKAAAAGR